MKTFIFGIIALTLSLGFVEKIEINEALQISDNPIATPISQEKEIASLEITKLNSFINTKNNIIL